MYFSNKLTNIQLFLLKHAIFGNSIIGRGRISTLVSLLEISKSANKLNYKRLLATLAHDF